MDSAAGAKDNGLVVSFASFEELLVRLLTDLAFGRASRHWYWQRWSYLFALPPGRAVAALMEGHADYLPAVTAGLARAAVLADVWHRLDWPDAHRLAAVVARRSDLSLQQIALGSFKIESSIVQPEIPPHLQTRWASTLEALNINDPRRLLALVLIGQETYPLRLINAPVRLLTALNQAFGASSQPSGHTWVQAPQQPSMANKDVVTAGACGCWSV